MPCFATSNSIANCIWGNLPLEADSRRLTLLAMPPTRRSLLRFLRSSTKSFWSTEKRSQQEVPHTSKSMVVMDPAKSSRAAVSSEMSPSIVVARRSAKARWVTLPYGSSFALRYTLDAINQPSWFQVSSRPHAKALPLTNSTERYASIAPPESTGQNCTS
jgi:hypothetical protein